ncbi:11827_t:CDS:1, partial [Racocetra fulgida]
FFIGNVIIVVAEDFLLAKVSTDVATPNDTFKDVLITWVEFDSVIVE